MTDRSMKGKRILITGIAGFGGSWLAETILQNESDVEVFGIKRKTTSTLNIDHLASNIRLFDADIVSYEAIDKAISEINPHFVFHLAAVASSTKAKENPDITMKTNVEGTRNLLSAVAEHAGDIEFFHFASTSTVYRRAGTGKNTLISEDNPTEPTDPYSASKLEAEKLCDEFLLDAEIPVVVTRAFNQGGPRCRDDIVANKIATLAADVKIKKLSSFAFGNVEAVRDFTDVRDIAFGYLAAAKKARIGEVYNLCNGKGIRIRDMIDNALEYVGAKGEVKITVDEKLFRKGEPDVIVGDNTKAKKELGWKPKIPFERTLKDMIDYYLSAAQG